METAGGMPPLFEATALRHPCAFMSHVATGGFVPNDVTLGEEEPPFILLTGMIHWQDGRGRVYNHGYRTEIRTTAVEVE